MSNLYNIMHGENQFANVLLFSLGFTSKDQIPRYRDCWFDGEFIVVYTRTGGGNRLFYDSEESCRENYPADFMSVEHESPKGPWNSDLRNNNNYVKDCDDFDATYAKFYFSIPESLKEIISQVEIQSLTPQDRFNNFMEKIISDKDDPDVKRVIDALKPTFENIGKALKDE